MVNKELLFAFCNRSCKLGSLSSVSHIVKYLSSMVRGRLVLGSVLCRWGSCPWRTCRLGEDRRFTGNTEASE